MASSSQHKVAVAFIDTFATLDVETNIALRTPTCKHMFAPASIPPPPTRNNTEFAAHLTNLKAVAAGFAVTIKEIFVPEKGDTVTVWATSRLQWREEAKDEGLSEEQWDYRGEYIFVLTFDESGEKLTRVLEFLDSKGTVRVHELIKRARANVARRAKEAGDAEG